MIWRQQGQGTGDKQAGLAESQSFGLRDCVTTPQAGSSLDTSQMPSERGSPTQGRDFLALTMAGETCTERDTEAQS